MSLIPRVYYDKHCFTYCGPERCDCKIAERRALTEQNDQMSLVERLEAEGFAKPPGYDDEVVL